MENGKSSIQFTMIAVELIFDNPKINYRTNL